MIPTLRRMVACYNPANPHSRQSVEFARDTARQLKVRIEPSSARQGTHMRVRAPVLPIVSGDPRLRPPPTVARADDSEHRAPELYTGFSRVFSAIPS